MEYWSDGVMGENRTEESIASFRVHFEMNICTVKVIG